MFSLLENTRLVKFVRNYIQDSSGIFSISSVVKILMISLISSLSLKLYSDSLVYDRNIFWSSPKVFGNFWKFSEISRKCSEQFWKIFEDLRKVVGNLPKIVKMPSSVCLFNKKNITRWLEDMNFMFSWQKQYLTPSLRSFVRYCSCH